MTGTGRKAVATGRPSSWLATLGALAAGAACTADTPPEGVTTLDGGAPVCAVGETFPCPCPEGDGVAVCLDTTGSLSQCGCPRPGGADVLVPPPPPVRLTCGEAVCDPYLEEETEVSARHCCTDAGACGSSSSFLFGAACVPRGGDPGVPDPACPDEQPNFLDLEGCCRPDGQCGLSVDGVPNWDAGCIERTEMARLLNDGAIERILLSLVFLLPYERADYVSIDCRP